MSKYVVKYEFSIGKLTARHEGYLPLYTKIDKTDEELEKSVTDKLITRFGYTNIKIKSVKKVM